MTGYTISPLGAALKAVLRPMLMHTCAQLCLGTTVPLATEPPLSMPLCHFPRHQEFALLYHLPLAGHLQAYNLL
jgi:hypothetical protein